MTDTKVINLFLTFFGLVKWSQLSREPQGLFQPADHQILATVDAVLATLNINDNFTKSKNITHYLALNKFVKDKVLKNDKIYQNIWRKCRSTSSNKTGVYVSIIDKIIGEMISTQKVKVSTDLLNNDKSNSRDTSHNKIVIDFIKFAKGFNLKLRTPSPYDLLGVRRGDKRPQWKVPGAGTRRIFNGTDTRIARYPFMASLHVRGRFVCAGSLVRADQIVSAASGLIPFISPQSDPRSVKARVGSDYTNKFGQLVPVAGFHFHPMFNRTTLRSNLVVILLKKPLQLGGGKLTTIQFDTTADMLPAEVNEILILGWGEKKFLPELGYKYDGSDQPLALTRLDPLDLKECKQTYSSTYVTNKHFCAGTDDKGGAACQFDVGGPAVAGRTLLGVASFGASRCGERGAPTVFTKLGFYADWIKSFFKEDLPHNQNNPKKTQSVKIQADEKPFYHKLKKTGPKSARQKELQELLYDIEEEDDTFKKTTKPDPHTHPLLDKAVFLDPELMPTMPVFSEELTEATPPQNIKTVSPPPLAADKEMENLDWEFAEDFLLEAIGSKKETTEVPTSTNTTTRSTLLPASLATIPQYPNLFPGPGSTTTESAYGEYSFDMKPRSTASPASTARNASAARAAPAMPSTRMREFFNARSHGQYPRSQHEFSNAKKDQEHTIQKMRLAMRGLGSIPKYEMVGKKYLQEVLEWQALRTN